MTTATTAATSTASPIAHIWWDFHHCCSAKRGGWTNLRKLGKLCSDDLGPQLHKDGPAHLVLSGFVNSLATPRSTHLSPIDAHSFFAVSSVSATEATLRQGGVIRTNCVDCLDRTNVAMTLFARRMLRKQLSHLGVDSGNGTQFPDWLEQRFRDVWWKNGNLISLMYAGTPALKADYTRKGRRTKTGALKDGMNSAQRYYLNHFVDPARQMAIDLFVTGKYACPEMEVANYAEGKGSVANEEVEATAEQAGNLRPATPAKLLALVSGCLLASLLVPLLTPV